MLTSNLPFGVDWKKIEADIKDEHQVKGFDGHFGAGLPRVSDGSLLFLMHLISKMRKSLGSKRNEMSEDDIKTIIRSFGDFEVIDARMMDKPADVKSNRGRQSANPKSESAKTFVSKIFNSYEFGYRRVTIERSLRLSAQINDEAVALYVLHRSLLIR